MGNSTRLSDPFQGAPASPEKFIKTLDTPAKIQDFFQTTLGKPLTEEMLVSKFSRMLLAVLHGKYPKAFDKYKPQIFVPGVPENIALCCLVDFMRQETYVRFNLHDIFKEDLHLITLNRVLAIALSNPSKVVDNEYSCGGAMSCETIGLLDTCRRTRNQLRSTGMVISPIEHVDNTLGNQVHDLIRNT